jgi:hypothetical protein
VRNNWGIPFWTEAQRVTGVADAQTVFNVDTTVHDLRAGSPVLLYQTYCKWEVKEIQSITGSSITLTNGTTLSGVVYVIPMLVGYVVGDITTSPTGFDSQAKLTFQITNVLTGLGVTVPPQYNGYDLYTDPYLAGDSSGGSNTFTQQQNTSDYDVGDIYQVTPWIPQRYSKNYATDGSGASDIRALKEFFYRRAGKFRPFYAPTFESNLRKASTGNITTTFKFYDDDFVAALASKRNVVAFGLDDGTWQLRPYSAPTALGDGTAQITLGSALNINASRILCVSYAALNRLDTDSLSIGHKQAGYFTSNFPALEIAA